MWNVPLVCLFCDESIVAGDDLARNLIGTEKGPRLAHEECAVRSIIGGVNHLQGNCTCCGGTMPPDPPGLTPRQAARAAYDVWMRKRTCR